MVTEIKNEILKNLNAHKTEMEACASAFNAAKKRKDGFDDMMSSMNRYNTEKKVVDTLIGILESCNIAYGWDPLAGEFYFTTEK